MKAVQTTTCNTVAAIDAQQDVSGMHHHYRVMHGATTTDLRFQFGPRAEPTSVHGVMMDDLLAIVDDMLSDAQRGGFACSENEAALRAVREARTQLGIRAARRLADGVLGTNAHVSKE